jgi:hypothetical protein
VRAAIAVDAVEVAAAREAAPLPVAGGHQGVSRLRPLARLRLITSRPERVRIRPRKPWVFARLRFFGCQVRFMIQRAVPAARSWVLGPGDGQYRDTPVPSPVLDVELPASLFLAFCGVTPKAPRARRYGRPSGSRNAKNGP